MKKILILLLSVLMTGCTFSGNSNSESSTASSELTATPTITPITTEISSLDSQENVELSAWTVYWDNENSINEIVALGDSLKNIIHFAGYFDAENKLFVPEETAQFFQTIKKDYPDKDYTHYISFVNDKLNSDGSSSLKDTKLLETLFSNDASIETHITDIISIAVNGGYDGIEIDYEAIKKNTKLWQRFISFITKLNVYTEQNNLKLRVVLEPSAPIGELDFPNGPEYVMMCYNLYGSGTTPGPKADKKFIKELSDKMNLLPGNNSFAFSVGGFDWTYKGKCTAVNELQAEELAVKYNVIPTRDELSGAMTFNYTDADEKIHEVWYSDGKTLNTWKNVLKENGENQFSLWRLNGNDIESLKDFGK